MELLGLEPTEGAVVADEVHGGVDDDHEPDREPFRSAFVEAGFAGFGPWIMTG